MLCVIDDVGLRPNIPYDDGLRVIRKALDLQKENRISIDSLIELENTFEKHFIINLE